MANSALVGLLRVLLSANTAEFQAGMKASAASAKAFSRDLATTGRQASQVGLALTKTLTLPILAAGAALIKVGVDFDKGTDTIRAATGATGKALDGLRASFKVVFASVPASIQDTATAIGDLNTRTGATGPVLEGLATQLLNLSRITKTEVAANVAGATRLFGDWSVASIDQAAALDQVFRASQSTGIGVTALMDRVVQFGAPLRQMGFSLEESIALLGKWEKEGVNSEAILGALKIGVANFAKAGIDGKAGLEQFVQQVTALGPGAEATSLAVKTFGSRAGPDMASAVLEGRFAISDYLTVIEGGTDTINGAAADTLSLGEKFTLLKNKLMSAVEPLGTALVDALESASDAAQPIIGAIALLAKGFTALPGPAKTMIVGLGLLAAATGPVLFIFGKLALMGSTLVGAFTKAGLASKLLGTDLATTGMKATATGSALGKLGAAASIASAAFVGWQIGRLIADWTGSDVAIGNLLNRMRGIKPGAQEAAAAQDTITLALQRMTAAERAANEGTLTYAKAVVFLTEWDRARIEGLKATADEQHRTTSATDDLTAALAEQSAKIREADTEIAQLSATARTKLAEAIRSGAFSMKDLSAATGLSELALKRFEDRLEAGTKALDKQQQAAEKAQAAQKALRDELDTYVLTQASLDAKLEHLSVLLNLAAKESTPALREALRTLSPQFRELETRALAAGLQVDRVRQVFEEFDVQAGLLQSRNLGAIFTSVLAPTAQVDAATQGLLRTVREQITAQNDLNAAYDYFGLKTPEALQRAAEAARQHYAALVEGGLATKTELTAAYDQMIAAQLKATGQLPSIWKTEVLPGITSVIGTIQTAVSGSFAQMLLGAKGFKDGWLDIWQSIKAGVLNILNSLLSWFMNSFLKGLLGALRGQQSAFAQAFGGLFAGAGGGGGGLPGLGSVFGGGGAAAGGLPGTAVGLPGGLGGGGTAAGGGAAAGVAGGAAAAGAGIALGLLGKQLFGGAGWKAAGFGAGTGAASGAAIGSIVPGLGTAIGAIVGGLAGAISGIFGKSQGMKTNDLRDQFLAQFGGAGTGAGSGFGTLAAELAQLSTASGGGEGGGTLFKDLISAKTVDDLKAAVDRVTAALGSAEYAGLKVRDAFDTLQQEQTRLVDGGEAQEAVVASQAVAYSQLLATIQATGAEAPAAMQPILEQLLDMGLLVDANGEKITTLADVHFQEVATAGQEALDQVDQALELNADSWQTWRERGGVYGKELSADMIAVGDAAQRSAGNILKAFDVTVPPIEVPYIYQQHGGGIPNLPNSSPPPGFATGTHGQYPDFGSGMLVELHGRERITPLGERESDRGGGQAPVALTVTNYFDVTGVLDEGALVQTTQRKIVPIITRTIEDGVDGLRTKWREGLGVSG